METTKSANIVGNAGAILLGLPVALAVALLFRWLWPVMTTPIFLTVLLCWFAAGISKISRRQTKRETPRAPWPIIDIFLATGSGLIPAALLAGFVGLYRVWLRWPVFVTALALWIAVGISVVVRDRAAARHRQT